MATSCSFIGTSRRLVIHGQRVRQESRSRGDGFGFSRSNGTGLRLPPKNWRLRDDLLLVSDAKVILQYLQTK